jgi:membrane-associated phospholipid phosphatase
VSPEIHRFDTQLSSTGARLRAGRDGSSSQGGCSTWTLPAPSHTGGASITSSALALYRHLKERLVRERPCVSFAGIEPGTAPLDRYSFPSGHTLHAVCFTTLATAHVPELAVLLVPFTLLVAASRVVLGMHYPSDVLAGAAIGMALARASLLVWPG